MADIVTDGDFTGADATGAPTFSAPLNGVNVNYVLVQEFVQLRENFTPLPLSTPHPQHPEFVLVAESEQDSSIGLGLVRWTRTYARVPDSYSEPGGNYAYTFIGFYGVFGINVTAITGRDRFTRNVPVLIERDFFLVGPDETYEEFGDIPINSAQRYYYGSTPELDVDYLADDPPFTEATVPSRTQYEALIAANAFNIVVEDSIIIRWMGNIYMRETRTIKAL